MTEKATLVVTATPNPNEIPSVEAYLKGMMPLLMGAGGILVKRQKVGKVINGRPSGMVLVMDFDSAEAVAGLFASKAYGDLIAVRDKGFTEMNILIAGDM